MRNLFLIFIFSLAISGCSKGFESTNSIEDPSHNLQTAKIRWESTKNSLSSYQLKLGQSGALGYHEVTSSVANSAVFACSESYQFWQDKNSTSTSCALEHGDTVESLFKKIEGGISSGQLSRAEYHPVYGVPTLIHISGSETEQSDAVNEYTKVIELTF